MGNVKIAAFPIPVRMDWKHTIDGGKTDSIIGSLSDVTVPLSHLQSSLPMNNWSKGAFQILLPSVTSRDIVYPVSRDGEIEMRLVSTADIEPGELEIPMLQLDYTMDNDGLGIDPRIEGGDPIFSITQGFKRAIEIFENELLFDVLAKAVRSQRNKVKKEISRESISETMQFSENLGFPPEVAVLNTTSHAKIRPTLSDSNGKLFGMTVLHFPPRRRGNKMRNYFLGDAGVSKRTPVSLEFDEEGNMTLSYQLGVVIFERNAITCLEEPE